MSLHDVFALKYANNLHYTFEKKVIRNFEQKQCPVNFVNQLVGMNR